MEKTSVKEYIKNLESHVGEIKENNYKAKINNRNMVEQVSDWLKVAGEVSPKVPTFPSKELFVRWFSMALEEMMETVDSAGYDTIIECQELFRERVEALQEPDKDKKEDIIELIDGLIDMPFVDSNLVYWTGISDMFEELVEEVTTSNFSKFCLTEERAIETVEAYEKGEHPNAKGRIIIADYKQSGRVFVVFDTGNNGKILKSLDFHAPDLLEM